MFDLEKKGYNRSQVNDFVAKTDRVMSALRAKNADLSLQISNLEDEIELIKNEQLKSQERTLKAIENENNNKKLYDLEMARLDSLISSWDETLKAIRKKYGVIPSVEKNALAFKNELEEKTQKVFDVTFGVDEKKADDKVYHKQLLSKMSGFLNSVSSNVASSSDYEIEKNEEFRRLDESLKSHNLKNSNKDYSSLLNKYLTEEDKGENSGYVSKDYSISNYFPEPNESGFDLKEAVNPKASLDDIMQDFDFYNPEENLKRKIKIK